MQRDDITKAAITVLTREGIAAWTTAAVAQEAGCAKGLIHYHHKTKSRLLEAMARRLAADRLAARLRPLGLRGTAALDGLWGDARSAVRSGRTQAWLGLLSIPDGAVRSAFVLSAAALADTSQAISSALDTDLPEPAVTRSLHATLDGLEVALVRGDDASATREAYHRFWLGIL